jgi:hypothetical protein
MIVATTFTAEIAAHAEQTLSADSVGSAFIVVS